MTSSEFRRWLRGLAEIGALVPATEALARLPGENQESDDHAGERLADLTCEDLAEEFDRTPACIRTWCREGKFEGAYRLNGREWRIPRESVRAYQREQSRSPGPSRRQGQAEADHADLGAWRLEK